MASSSHLSHRHRAVLRMVRDADVVGLTALELSQEPGWERPGVASGALSVLDDLREVVMLREKRGTHHVYVHPAYKRGRPAASHRNSKMKALEQRLENLEAAVALLQQPKKKKVRVRRVR